jgi:alginate O-acetyltransferase complex protein AlgJ
MPNQIEVIGKQSRMDQLLAYQRLHGKAQILDFRPALLEASKEHLVYYKTDTHWNSYGAYAAYVEIMAALQKDFPNVPGLEPHALGEFRYVPDGEGIGDIGYRWVQGAPVEPFFNLAPVFDRQIHKFDSYQDRVIYSHRYNQGASKLPTAVIFHDSFMDWLAPFLTDHLQRAVFARALDMDKGMDELLVESEKPDIVIFECNERWLERLLYLPKHDTQGE